jgi:hypothetical protein
VSLPVAYDEGRAYGPVVERETGGRREEEEAAVEEDATLDEVDIQISGDEKGGVIVLVEWVEVCGSEVAVPERSDDGKHRLHGVYIYYWPGDVIPCDV